jgi:hypothetical protein
LGLFLWAASHFAPGQHRPAERPLGVQLVRVHPPKKKATPGPVRRVTPAPPHSPKPAQETPSKQQILANGPTVKSSPLPDVPRAIALGPKSRPGPGLAVPGEDTAGGHLLHNDPGELPSQEQLARQEVARVRELTEGFAQDVFAERRATNGLVDPYFDDMRKALEEASKDPPPFRIPESPPLASWAQGASSFGGTGNPYGEDNPAFDPLTDSVGRLAMQQDQAFGGPYGLQNGSANMAQLLAYNRDFLHPKEPGITAVVELLQEANGQLRSVKLLSQSGDKGFDSYVLGAAPSALKLLPPPPDHGPGLHSDGIHSAWAFTGHRVFLKDLKDFKTPKEKAYAAGMGALSALTGGGQFDVTGQMRVPDLLHPRYTSTVRLLRIY